MSMSTACPSVSSTGTAPRSSPQEPRGRAVLFSQWLHKASGMTRFVAARKSTFVNTSSPEGDPTVVDNLMITCAGH